MAKSAGLIDAVLVPPGTVLTGKGDSPAVSIVAAENHVFLLTLKITEAVEHEYIELWLFGSADGTTWGVRPLASLPQRFYPGEYPTLIDLTADSETKFLRVHWELSRWGRGELTSRFQCGISLREVPAEMLREARVEAQSRR